MITFRRYIITLRKILNDYKYKDHQTKLSVKDINRKFTLYKKKNTIHFTQIETSSPQNTEAMEEDKKWIKMINHTLFLQLNGQRKRKGQEQSDSMSITDGLSDNKSLHFSKMKKNNQKKGASGQRRDITNSIFYYGGKINPNVKNACAL